VTDPYTFKSLPYDPMKDFTVLSDIAEVRSWCWRIPNCR
jgi:hypothetical protein